MTKAAGSVDRLYRQLREMAADFAFKPDERINESDLATRLGASRTPMREALNRLAAEGFVTFQSGKGFFCRPLTPARILELYEARVAIECEGVRLACLRGSEEGIAALAAHLDGIEPLYVTANDTAQLLELDEDFHLRLIGLSGNAELDRLLRNLNDRIRYVRLIDLRRIQAEAGSGPQTAPESHRKIVSALEARQMDEAVAAMRQHISRRSEEATEAVRIAYSQLYVPDH